MLNVQAAFRLLGNAAELFEKASLWLSASCEGSSHVRTESSRVHSLSIASLCVWPGRLPRGTMVAFMLAEATFHPESAVVGGLL